MTRALKPFLLIAVLLLSACGGEGYANVESRCNMSGRSGTCTLTIVEIEGSFYRHEFQNSDFWPGASSVQVSMTVSVEKGSVRVWLQDPQQNEVAAIVGPGETIELAGQARLDTLGDEPSFYVYFEPLITDDAPRAENVRAEIRYDMP